jgi:uncharacterized damage-inducible protein DinB/predicted RNase H-like HicB family nuclease
MYFRLTIEDIEPNHWVAYALDLPGCFSSAQNSEGAIAQAPERIAEHLAWLSKHMISFVDANLPIEVEIVEQFRSYESAEEKGYIVNAFFEDDRRPLGIWDVEVALRLMAWSRNDLLDLVRGVKDEQLNKNIPGETFVSVAGILKHIAIAENWYFGHMGFGLERKHLPEDVFEMLAEVRGNAEQHLVKLMGDQRIVNECGEYWSGRKVLRRMLWHERDHTRHIAQIFEKT